MLVLSRKKNETINFEVEGLDSPIKVIIVKIDKNRVRIGVEADREKVLVVRSELMEDSSV